MTIETTDDLIQQIADWIGVYGACKASEDNAEHANGCENKNPLCCRTGFEMVLKERMFQAVENDKKMGLFEPIETQDRSIDKIFQEQARLNAMCSIDENEYGRLRDILGSRKIAARQYKNVAHDSEVGKLLKELIDYHNRMLCIYMGISVDPSIIDSFTASIAGL